MSSEVVNAGAAKEKNACTPIRKLEEGLKLHGELIAAIISGLLVLTAWSMEDRITASLFIFLHLSAFLIGGFAKAKEGIIETIQDRKLNVEMLMVFAAIGSAAIGYWTEGAILIFIFALSGALETYTMNKSQKELSGLMDLQPQTAMRLVNGKEIAVAVSELEVGDLVFIKAGESVPADGQISRGSTSLDESAITGEAFPVEKQKGDNVFAGTINLNGTITVEVSKLADETLFQKIIYLVQSAQSEKSPSQLFIERFEGVYVKVVLLAVLLMMIFPPYVVGWSWQETIYRAMVLLVVASPCALVASIMPAMLSSISNGARRGILFKGGIHLEKLSRMKVVAFDKTGTLTEGYPHVTDAYFRDDDGSILENIRAIEANSNHPLAQSIVRYAESQKYLPKSLPEQITEERGHGVKAVLGGSSWKIGSAEFVGREESAKFQGGIAGKLAAEGKTVVFAADEKGIAAVIALKDTVRAETATALKSLQQNGIITVMLTGDNEKTAAAIAAECGIDDFAAACLPDEKLNRIKQLKDQYGAVGMVGDGINDAPALATANVGIAMGAGTDVALETADIVLMKNDLSKIADAVSLSRRMSRIIKQNVFFSVAVILLLIMTNFLQLLDLPLGVIGHEGSTILVILNGLRLLR
ncbi:heavy metal translocating P-type ATPase [Sediminibacillus halophilus]|uniref:Cd2+/Zn2+-exporting ATPase n=1 Tax=Sediminibacillus halophilus TaxID=482461 RepID=A0A1G9NPW1_9BACI|nr:heavy metal translocating P-type ATPase [Sediminibacillus halophilus]SDL88628.1 Cd2+/Zn2+-exporting ATPase [Sediminibacillus halophilus]